MMRFVCLRIRLEYLMVFNYLFYFLYGQKFFEQVLVVERNIVQNLFNILNLQDKLSLYSKWFVEFFFFVKWLDFLYLCVGLLLIFGVD